MVRVSDAIEGGEDDENATGVEVTRCPDSDMADQDSCPGVSKQDWKRPPSVTLKESPCLSEESNTMKGQVQVQVGVEEAEAMNVGELLREPMHKTLHKQQGGYECKYCPFSTQNLSTFKEHVDLTHPNVILNPLYLCAVCNFSTRKFDLLTEHNDTQHPGETNFKFKRIKLNSQTVLEQTIENEPHSLDLDNEDMEILGDAPDSTLGNSTVVVKAGKPKEIEEKHFFGKGDELQKHFESLISKDQITAVNVNGTVIIPDPTILQGLSHVMPLLQRPPNLNSAPKIAVPLNTTKYNPLLDNNAILMTSFNKFPYPTHAELSWLTAASKHPEEQIKVWFTTQRLKQGITWSPEEVEEARKKMFNGSIPPVHHTFTVLPDSITTPAKSLLPLSQAVPGSVLGPPSAAVSSRTSLLASPSVTVTTVNHGLSLKRTLAVPGSATEVKRAMLPSSVDNPKDKDPMPPPPTPPPIKDRLPMAPPPVPPEIKRPSSSPFLAPPDMKRPLITPIVTLKGKPPVALPLVASKERLPMAPPLMLPKERLATSLAFSADIKQPVLSPKSKNQVSPLPVVSGDMKLPMAPPLAIPQMKRPTIIQTTRGPSKTIPLPPNFSQESWQLKELQPRGEPRGRACCNAELVGKETNGISRGEAKSWLHHEHYLNGSLNHTNSDLVPIDRPRPVPTQFPLLERVKGKTTEQLKILEESFQRNSFPSHAEADGLATVTRLSRDEIDSWFLERRALRDNLEQALLNSMGAKRLEVLERRQQQQQQQKQTTVLNGAHKPAGLPLSPLRPILAPAVSPKQVDSKSLGLLKDVFVQTQWPSPEEYNILESQTGLARTEIVRWFKESRSDLRNGTLDWLEESRKSHGGWFNGQGLSLPSEHATSKVTQHFEDTTKTAPTFPIMTAMITRADEQTELRECAKLKSQELKEWFANTLSHGMPDMNGKNGGQNGGGRGDCGSWIQDPVVRRAAGEVAKELVSDTD